MAKTAQRVIGIVAQFLIFTVLIFAPGPGFLSRATLAAPLYWTGIISADQLDHFALDVHLPNAWFGLRDHVR